MHLKFTGLHTQDPHWFEQDCFKFIPYEISLHSIIQCLRFSSSDRVMDGDKKNNSIEILASLAHSHAEVGAGLRLGLTNNLQYLKKNIVK